jgi:hypothetical protein
MSSSSILPEGTIRQAADFANAVEKLRVQDLPAHERVALFKSMVETGRLPSLEPLLPMLLNLKGAPYTLKDHFPFAPVFYTHIPRVMVFLTARQVSKSTSMASSSIVHSATTPNLVTLFVLPLFEQVRRFSNNYVKPFINESSVKQLLTGGDQQILQRTFRNNAKMLFSFAFLNADRTRGIGGDVLIIDEMQDIDPSLIPIIQEVLSASKKAIIRYTGTPKTNDNTAQIKWQASSQAEWWIPCQHCTTNGFRTWNIPCLDYHAERMIGGLREDISEARPAVVCYKCGQPIYPRMGRWVHRYPEKRWDFAGYHLPQIIMPIHYSMKFKWANLLTKQGGGGNTGAHVFVNEVMGESYDTGAKLVTETDLKMAACLPYTNNVRTPSPDVLARVRDYPVTVLAFDWGGGGADEISYTTAALLGYNPSGQIDVLWGTRLATPNDHLREARQCFEFFRLFRPSIVAHDYTGAGTIRETFLMQAGVPRTRIMPISYVSAAAGGLITPVQATVLHPRDHFRLDKTRSLLNTVTAIKTGLLRFFRYDRISPEDSGLIGDFLALTEEKVSTRIRSDTYIITRGNGSDDFAQAVNIGCASIWHTQNAWPNFVDPGNKYYMSRAEFDAYDEVGKSFFDFREEL